MPAPTFPVVTPRWLDADQQHAWRNYLRGSASLQEAINHDLEQSAGLSLSEYEVLVRLSEAEGRTLRMSVLADELVHSRSRLTHTIRRMEAAGLVERTTCAEDRRGVNATLTDEGYARLEGAAPGHVESVRARMVDRLTPEQMRVLGEIMAVFIDDEDEDEGETTEP